jgi:transcriptional regulator with XRE-family HTH domain
MTNIPEQIKKALFEKGWTQKKLCSEIDVTENGFKRMADNNTWKLETLEKISIALGAPVSYFLGETNINFDQHKLDKSAGKDDVYLQEYLRKLEDKFNKLLDQLAVKDHQLESKDQQIGNLQEMLKMILGKLEGADLDQLLQPTDDVIENLKKYNVAGIAKSVLPMLVEDAIFLKL